MLFQHVEPSNGSPAPMLGRVSSRTLAAMVVAILPLFAPARAKADLTLGEAADFGILGKTINLGGGTVINGNVGVIAGGNLATGGTIQTFNGTISVDNTPGDAASTSFSNFGQHPPATTSMSLSGAASDLLTASQGAAALGSTQSFSSLSGTTITGNGGVNVVDVGSISGAVTLNGLSSDYFVINVSGNVDFGGGSGVTLGTNVLASHVLFNVSGNVTLESGNTVYGTFLSSGGSINIGGGSTVNGALLDVNSMVSVVDVKSDSSMTLNGTGNEFAGLVSAPEPAPLVKAISGLATIGIWGFVRRKRSKSK
jgi:hypothetical protein